MIKYIKLKQVKSNIIRVTRNSFKTKKNLLNFLEIYQALG